MLFFICFSYAWTIIKVNEPDFLTVFNLPTLVSKAQIMFILFFAAFSCSKGCLKIVIYLPKPNLGATPLRNRKWSRIVNINNPIYCKVGGINKDS